MDAVTEWVEGDWNAVKVGDLVRLERGNEIHQFAVRFWSTDTDQINRWFESNRHGTYNPNQGWALFVPAPPKPELPTEPGFYLDRMGSVWVHVEGDLRFVGAEVERPDLYAPFTKLEPRAVTAKAVLERMASWWEFGPPKNWADEFDNIAAEFGVDP